jgi:hypothetical protein
MPGYVTNGLDFMYLTAADFENMNSRQIKGSPLDGPFGNSAHAGD